MHCPTLEELPTPPADRSGWPWNQECPQLPDKMPDGSPWPPITIVTPSYNQDAFIEETIRSVLLQGYPNLEYIIIDGGSTDASLTFIRKYEKWLSFWTSEKDAGQSHAINKGLSRASGEISNWINSDDYLEMGALSTIGSTFVRHPHHLLVGAVKDYNSLTGVKRTLLPKRISRKDIIHFWQGWYNWVQPSIFFPRLAFVEAGGLDHNLHYVMDLDLYCRLLETCPIYYIDDPLTTFRRHDSAKTQRQYHNMMLELAKVSLRYMHLAEDTPADEHVRQLIAFLLRRAYRLLLDGKIKYFLEYILYSLRVNPAITVKSAITLACQKYHA